MGFGVGFYTFTPRSRLLHSNLTVLCCIWCYVAPHSGTLHPNPPAMGMKARYPHLTVFCCRYKPSPLGEGGTAIAVDEAFPDA